MGTTDDFTSEEPLVLEREIERGREGGDRKWSFEGIRILDID